MQSLVDNGKNVWFRSHAETGTGPVKTQIEIGSPNDTGRFRCYTIRIQADRDVDKNITRRQRQEQLQIKAGRDTVNYNYRQIEIQSIIDKGRLRHNHLLTPSGKDANNQRYSQREEQSLNDASRQIYRLLEIHENTVQIQLITDTGRQRYGQVQK